jgi:hypothetical protein
MCVGLKSRRILEPRDVAEHCRPGGNDDTVVRVERVDERARHRLADTIDDRPIVERDAQRLTGIEHAIDAARRLRSGAQRHGGGHCDDDAADRDPRTHSPRHPSPSGSQASHCTVTRCASDS